VKVERIEPVLAKPEVTPLMQVWWRTHLSFWHYINGRYGDSSKVMTEARVIAERYGLEAYLFEIDHADASALINKGDHAAAKALLEAMERRLSPNPLVTIHKYPGADHAFARRGGKTYSKPEADRALGLTLDFFNRHL